MLEPCWKQQSGHGMFTADPAGEATLQVFTETQKEIKVGKNLVKTVTQVRLISFGP